MFAFVLWERQLIHKTPYFYCCRILEGTNPEFPLAKWKARNIIETEKFI